MSSFGNRVIRAIRLDKQLYEEVEADRTATRQAMSVVILSALTSAIGSSGEGGSLVAGVLTALGGWVIAALIIYVVGAKLLPEPETSSNPGELLRTLGFANAPGLLFLLAVVPGLTSIVQMAVGIWILAAWVIAVRQALDYRSTGRAVLVCVLGWLVFIGGIMMLGFFIKGVGMLLG